MGYFKRTVRRGAARGARLAFLADSARAGEASGWRRCDWAERPAVEGFVRFVVELPGVGNVGLFREQEALEEAEHLPAEAWRAGRAALRWFDTHLPVPDALPPEAVCWFRADARGSLRRIWDVVDAYRAAGYVVWMRVTRNPGRVVYRDRYQVAAVGYRDQRVRVKPVRA